MAFTDDEETPPRRHGPVMARLRNYFLTGLVIAAPVSVTLWVTWTLIGWVDGWIKPLIPARYNPDSYLPFPVPGFGLIVALVGLTLLGFLAANLVGRTLVSLGENLVGRMPLVRTVYRGSKQIFETVLTGKGQTFQKAGVIEYPRPGSWALVFVATAAKGELATRLADDGEELLSVFLPTTPNPTSGFLLYVKRKDVVMLDMSVEDAAKLIISAGLVAPEHRPPGAPGDKLPPPQPVSPREEA